MIRVLLVDDHQVVLAGLSRLLDGVPDIEVVGQAGDGAAAVVLDGQVSPDVVLMDLSMPGMGGVQATARIVGSRPAARVVALTSTVDHDAVLGALDAGACGYLLKDAEPGVLIEGIRAAARGESPLHPKAARHLLEARATRGQAARLTGREEEVLRLVAQGLLNKQIARLLGIGEKTVKAHLTNIFQRLGVRDRAEAVRWAERYGYLDRVQKS